MAIFKTGVTL